MAMASPVAKLHDNSEDRTIAFLAKMEMGERREEWSVLSLGFGLCARERHTQRMGRWAARGRKMDGLRSTPMRSYLPKLNLGGERKWQAYSIV